MGHDITVGPYGVITYITGNFSRLDGKYGGIYDFHGHRGQTVARIANSILKKLAGDGIVPGEPNGDNNWYWGARSLPPEEHKKSSHGFTITTAPMDEKEFLSVFAYHMERFKELGEQYPNDRFHSDQVWEVRPFEDGEYVSDGECYESEESEEDGEDSVS